MTDRARARSRPFARRPIRVCVSFVMRGVVPDVILDRKDKIGFATPEKDWLLALRPWVDGVLEGATASRIRAIDSGEVRREWARIVRGERTFDARVWRWVSTVLWAQRFEVQFD